jgi:hypothetical protein
MPVDTLTYQYTGELTVVSLIITYVSKLRLVAGFRASALNSVELAERHWWPLPSALRGGERHFGGTSVFPRERNRAGR